MVVACINFLHGLYIVTNRAVLTVQYRTNFSHKTVTALLTDKNCPLIHYEYIIILPVHQFAPIS
jgi:hypothetical protein